MLREKYEDAMEHFAPHTALAEVFRVIDRANKYIDENAPWALAKNMEQNGARLAHVLYNLLEVTRICGVLLMPFIPGSCERLFAQIGAAEDGRYLGQRGPLGYAGGEQRCDQGGEPVPRIDMEKALTELEEAEAEARKAALPPH